LQIPKRRKPRTDGVPPLNQQRILRAALALIDREGLAAFSMRRLGAELGVEAMSLYRYFRNKDEVFDGLVDSIKAEIQMPPVNEKWEEELTALAQAYRVAISAHPAALPIIATRPVQTPATLAIAERTLDALARAGWQGEQGMALLNVLGAFVIGFALMDVGPTPASEQPTTPPLSSSFSASLLEQSFPHITALLTTHGDAFNFDMAFTLGVQTFIHGLRR
jgi:TetR/AcrR family tetracycline transcriptional repressor